MDYTTMGRMGDYVKNLRMESKWTEKKKTKNYMDKETLAESHLSEYEKNRRNEIESVSRQVEEMNKNKDADLDRIKMKMYNGKELTASEKEYLRRKSPELYQEVVETEQEQKSYEEALKKCRTKEDVQRLKNMEMGQRLSAVKSIMNNPNIPEGEKLGLVMKEYKKMKAVLEVEKKFVESGAYEELPTDAEYSDAVQEENEINKEEIQDGQYSNEQEDTLEEETSLGNRVQEGMENLEGETNLKESIGFENSALKPDFEKAELEKDIEKARDKYEAKHRNKEYGGDYRIDAVYKIETIGDLMDFGGKFARSLGASFEVKA